MLIKNQLIDNIHSIALSTIITYEKEVANEASVGIIAKYRNFNGETEAQRNKIAVISGKIYVNVLISLYANINNTCNLKIGY